MFHHMFLPQYLGREASLRLSGTLQKLQFFRQPLHRNVSTLHSRQRQLASMAYSFSLTGSMISTAGQRLNPRQVEFAGHAGPNATCSSIYYIPSRSNCKGFFAAELIFGLWARRGLVRISDYLSGGYEDY
jgi:hypothetical protein